MTDWYINPTTGIVTRDQPHPDIKPEDPDVLIEQLRQLQLASSTPPSLELIEYQQGDSVQVFHPNSGEWIDGNVSEGLTEGIGFLHVQTPRGPLTIGNKNRIRRNIA